MIADETAASAANLAFYRALEARDLSAMELVWLQDDVASCVHPGWHRLEGWAEIRRSWKTIFANSRPWTVSCERVRVSVSPHLAWVTCVEAITPFGGVVGEDTMRMQATNIFARSDGQWLMVHHHASPFSMEDGEEKETVH